MSDPRDVMLDDLEQLMRLATPPRVDAATVLSLVARIRELEKEVASARAKAFREAAERIHKWRLGATLSGDSAGTALGKSADELDRLAAAAEKGERAQGTHGPSSVLFHW